MEASVGVRELQQNLSKYLERVMAGESLVVAERGTTVARLVPAGGVSGRLRRTRGAVRRVASRLSDGARVHGVTVIAPG
jgi:prevent-host-death family protein